MILGAALLLPILMLLACLSERMRERMPAWLAAAPVPALAAALFGSGASLDLPPLLLRIRLALDVPAAVLLGAAALLWIAGGVYTASWLRGRADAGRFVVWWLLTLTGSMGVFMAADLVGFYLLFSLVSLAAYGLIVDDGTARSRKAGAITVALAVLGEAFLLLAFVMLAQGVPGKDLSIGAAVAALPASPWREAVVALLILGFGVKVGMVPFHVWMPLAYRSAPIPAAAVLSGAAVKAGVIGFLRFLPLAVPYPGWGEAMVAAGFASAFFGVAVGITRSHPKTVLAYSSVSQMGLIVAVLGMGLAERGSSVALPVAFYAAHHTLVKGALFLAVGAAGARDGRRVRWVLLPAAVLALGMAGLPLTGGALAKLAVKPALGDGFVGLMGSLSSAATALLMIHFLLRLAAFREGRVAARLRLPWLAVALACVAVPWGLYLTLMGGTAGYALSGAVVWASVWPVLLGGVLAAAWWRWGDAAPRLPDGDVVVLVAKDAIRAADAGGAALERLDGWLRQWPVAVTALLTIAAALAGLMMGWR